MKNFFKNKIFIIIGICIVVVITIAATLKIFSKKESKLDLTKKAIENVFFYLPEDKYDDVTGIPDYCKVSLVYGTKFVDNYKIVNKEDTSEEQKKENNKTTRAYSTEDIENGVKKILGDSTSINYNVDSEGDYIFITENGCGYNNKNINVLSYDEESKYITSLDVKNDKVSKVYTKWIEKENKNNTIVYDVYALEANENSDGSYDIYADKDHENLVTTIEKGKKLTKEVNKLFEEKSNVFVITIEKNNGNYIWKSIEVKKIYENDIIVD